MDALAALDALFEIENGSPSSATTTPVHGLACSPASERARRSGQMRSPSLQQRGGSSQVLDLVKQDTKSEDLDDESQKVFDAFGLSDDDNISGVRSIAASRPIRRSKKASRVSEEYSDQVNVDMIPCMGCKRDRLKSQCFYSGGLVEWGAPNRKGAWCRDCFNAWRLLYSGLATLVMFSVWLRNPGNFIDWQMNLLAFVSLKRDGMDRATAAAVQARRHMIEWLFKTLCIHPGRNFVVPISVMDKHRDLCAARFVSMLPPGLPLTSPERCLGYVMDSPNTSDLAMLIPRPMDGSWNGFLMASMLETTRPEDRDLVESMCAGAPTSFGVAEAEVLAVVSAAFEHESKMQKDARELQSWTVSQIAPFSLASWTEVKEASFTATLNKFNTLKTEASHTEDSDFVDSLGEWAHNLLQGKVFMSRHRQFVRGSPKIAKLVSLHPHIGKFIDFLSKHLEVHISLTLLRYKVEFVSSSDSTWAQRFAPMLAGGLEAALISAPADANLDTWLRSSLFTRLAHDLENLQASVMEAHRSVLMEDLDYAIAWIDNLSVRDKLNEVAEDLKALRVMLLAGRDPPEASATAAQEAMVRIESNRLELLRSVLTKGLAGREYLAALSEILIRGENDVTGDCRLKLASDAFVDPEMFRISPGALSSDDRCSMAVLKNCKLAQFGNPTMYNSLSQILQYTFEAIRFWSPIRQHEQKQRVDDVFASIFDTLVAIDLVNVSAFAKAVRETETTEKMMTDDDGLVKLGPFPSVLSKALEELDVTMYSENSVFHSARNTFMAQFGTCCLTLSVMYPDVTKQAHVAIRNAKSNYDLLQDIAEFVEILRNLDEHNVTDLTGEDLASDWQAKGKRSVLSTLIATASIANKLDGMTFDFNFLRMHDLQEVCLTVGCESETPGSNRYPMADLCDVPRMLAATPVAKHAAQLVIDTSVDILRTFVTTCETDGLKEVKSFSTHASMPLQSMASTLMDAAAMPRTCLAATRAFRQVDRPFMLGSSHAFAVVCEMFDLCKAGSINLTEGFLHGDAACELQPAELKAMCANLKFMHEAASVVAFLSNELKVHEGISDHKVRSEIMDALCFGESKATEALDALNVSENLFRVVSALPVKWFSTAEPAKLWFDACVIWFRSVKTHLFDALTNDMSKLAHDLEKITPKHTGICSDTNFVPHLIRKHLVYNPTAKQMSTLTIALYHSMQNLGKMSTKFGITIVCDPETPFNQSLSQARAVYHDAKEVMTITAAATIVLAMPADEAIEEAAAFLEKRQSVPLTMLEKLNEISLKSMPAKKQIKT